MALARDAVLWAAETAGSRAPPEVPLRAPERASLHAGETLDEAIAAAKRLQERGLPTMFTALGENVIELADARRVVQDYRDAYDRVAAAGLDTEFSVKPSHLGLDQDPQVALANLRSSRPRRPNTTTGCGSTWSRRRMSTGRSTCTASSGPGIRMSASASRPTSSAPRPT